MPLCGYILAFQLSFLCFFALFRVHDRLFATMTRLVTSTSMCVFFLVFLCILGANANSADGEIDISAEILKVLFHIEKLPDHDRENAWDRSVSVHAVLRHISLLCVQEMDADMLRHGQSAGTEDGMPVFDHTEEQSNVIRCGSGDVISSVTLFFIS